MLVEKTPCRITFLDSKLKKINKNKQTLFLQIFGLIAFIE